MSKVIKKEIIENVEKLFYKQEKKDMKNLIPTRFTINNWINKWSWKSNKSNKGVLKMLMEMENEKTNETCKDRIILQSLKNRKILALYEDLGYLKDKELNLYVMSF